MQLPGHSRAPGLEISTPGQIQVPGYHGLGIVTVLGMAEGAVTQCHLLLGEPA